MDAWFWLHMYIVFRGLLAILIETIAEIAGSRPEEVCCVQMRMPTLASLFKYMNRLRAYDVGRRKHWSFPRLIVEGTYFPPEAHVRPFFKVEGQTTARDKKAMADIVSKYPGFQVVPSSQPQLPTVTWMRVVALKVHHVYRRAVLDIRRVCLHHGAFLVLTITNDPTDAAVATTIGLHDAATKNDIDVVLHKIPNLKRVSF